ncbi:hypothetical protein D9758_004785 [Tetrapyrgos nigripes]|uniref:PEBP-like protein n=1 Tax=Tetrapyrgos nigripes TaxID=182062 RepID=A0A8H5G693_9AGAR|nr:hypothetical protein D9758_004785 [Tetrapyrgos nigripes]
MTILYQSFHTFSHQHSYLKRFMTARLFFIFMMLTTLPVAGLLLAATASAQFAAELNNVTQAVNQAKVVPDVLSSFNPRALLNVTFNATQAVNVTPGILLTMEQTAQEPQFFFLANQTIPAGIQYVLSIVDPDAPTPQNTSISQFRHMLGGGFVIDNATGMLTNNTPALSDFVPPTPPQGSDPHRYVMLAYLQPPNFDGMASQFVNASTDRQNFNITAFAMQTNLSEPLAANFFFTGPSNSSGNASSSGTGSAASPSGTSPAGDTGNAVPGKQILGGMTAVLGVVWGILLVQL